MTLNKLRHVGYLSQYFTTNLLPSSSSPNFSSRKREEKKERGRDQEKEQVEGDVHTHTLGDRKFPGRAVAPGYRDINKYVKRRNTESPV